jgi:hypothetical protein
MHRQAVWGCALLCCRMVFFLPGCLSHSEQCGIWSDWRLWVAVMASRCGKHLTIIHPITSHKTRNMVLQAKRIVYLAYFSWALLCDAILWSVILFLDQSDEIIFHCSSQCCDESLCLWLCTVLAVVINHFFTEVCSSPPGQCSWYSDSLQTGRSGDWFLVAARFSTPVQTGPGAHPAFYTVGNRSFPGVKELGRGVDHPPHLALRLKEE